MSAEVNSIVHAEGLGAGELTVMIREYALHYSDGSARIEMLPSDGRGAVRVFNSAGRDDRLALLDMPLHLTGPAAYRPVVQWLAFGRRGGGTTYPLDGYCE